MEGDKRTGTVSQAEFMNQAMHAAVNGGYMATDIMDGSNNTIGVIIVAAHWLAKHAEREIQRQIAKLERRRR